MSFGALSANAKVALGRAASLVGNVDDHRRRRDATGASARHSKTLVYEVLPSRYGINIHHLRQADAIELTIGQGAKPGTGRLLLGSKVSDEIAAHARSARRASTSAARRGTPTSSAPTT